MGLLWLKGASLLKPQGRFISLHPCFNTAGLYSRGISKRAGQRAEGHILLFEALRLALGTTRKVTGTTYLQLSVSSAKDIQAVINLFSFSGLHPLAGLKMEQYQRWLSEVQLNTRLHNIKTST